jgi:hypothetical protein
MFRLCSRTVNAYSLQVVMLAFLPYTSLYLPYTSSPFYFSSHMRVDLGQRLPWIKPSKKVLAYIEAARLFFFFFHARRRSLVLREPKFTLGSCLCQFCFSKVNCVPSSFFSNCMLRRARVWRNFSSLPTLLLSSEALVRKDGRCEARVKVFKKSPFWCLLYKDDGR